MLNAASSLQQQQQQMGKQKMGENATTTTTDREKYWTLRALYTGNPSLQAIRVKIDMQLKPANNSTTVLIKVWDRA